LAAFVFDKRKKPLMPCGETGARLVVTGARAVVHPRHPFAIRLQERAGGNVEPVRVKIDHGSKTTRVAIITAEDRNKLAKVLCLFGLARRGRQISGALAARRGFRRRGGDANLRSRAPRRDNRGAGNGRRRRHQYHTIGLVGGAGRDRFVGPVAVRASGSCAVGNADGINANYGKLPPPVEGGGLRRRRLG
jgi:hypothetical protein